MVDGNGGVDGSQPLKGYPEILVEGRYAARNDTNNLCDSLIDAPDSIDHPDIRWYPLDRCRCLYRIKCNVGGGAKIERSGGTVPQLTKTGRAFTKIVSAKSRALPT